MPDYDYDLFVIGAGSGGVRCARMSAGFGARVAVAEERYLGGTCVNVGCVPKKLFVYAAHYREELEDARGFGWDVAATGFDWQHLLSAKNAEIERLNGVYERLLRNAGVQLIEERARLLDAHTVEVDGRRCTAERILVATGSWPSVPDLPGREHVITSNEAFFLPHLPRRVAIVGGGYIAVEFAGIFNGLGCETHLLYRGGMFLRGFDDDARAFLAREMQAKGVQLHFDTDVERIEKSDRGLRLHLAGGGHLDADTAMYATGRAPNVEGIGLEACGVKLDWNGAVVVDEYYRSSTPSVYAIGDVTHRVNLTPVAIAEAMALARTLYAAQPTTLDYGNIPSCIFSQPNLGMVGLTEAQAHEHYGEIDVYRSEFRPMKHTLSGRGERTLMKLVVARETDRVVGVHMVGPEAGEIIQGMAIALKAGATKAIFDATIGIHPTAAEEFVTLREPIRKAPAA